MEIRATLDEPIALNFLGDATKRYITLCAIHYRWGDHELVVPARFEFDGPTIPRWCWSIAGLSPADIETVFASCIHDLICERPWVLPRIVGDAIFFVTLGPLRFNDRPLHGAPYWRRRAMYLAVRLWSVVSGHDWGTVLG